MTEHDPRDRYRIRQAAMLMKDPAVCGACGRAGPTAPVTLRKNVGMLLVRETTTIDEYLCESCIRRYFDEYTSTTLCGGWWGVISFFATPFIILENITEYRRAIKAIKDQSDVHSGQLPAHVQEFIDDIEYVRKQRALRRKEKKKKKQARRRKRKS